MAEDIHDVKPHIQERAWIKSMEEYQRLYRLSLDNPEWFWGEQAKTLTWFHPWHTVFDADYEEVDFSWFAGGRLNACFNCVDRHLATHGDRTAIIWAADEPGVYKHISYREMKHHVCRIANVLHSHGVKDVREAADAVLQLAVGDVPVDSRLVGGPDDGRPVGVRGEVAIQ